MGGPTHIGARSAPKGIGLVQVIGRDTSGNVYVADSSNHRIRKITAGRVVSTLACSTRGHMDGTDASARFNGPTGVAIDSAGNVYVADRSNNRIRKVTAAGVVTTIAGSGAEGFANGIGTSAQFHRPHGVAVDSVGNVYVADSSNHRIRKITVAGVVSTLAGSATAGFRDDTGTWAGFNDLSGVAVDSDGNVYVADYGNNRIRKIEYRVP